jgi:Ca-activated chloride channel family protein
MRPLLIILCFGLMAAVNGQKENALIRQGNKAFGSGKYEEAEKDYRKALEQNKESFPGQFNLGAAIYQKKDYKESANIYSNLAARSVDKTTKSKIYHNLGNTFLEGKEYEKSIAAYKNALLNNPGDLDTKYNLEYARMMLQKQQQQQQQDQKKDQKDKQDQNQNKDQNQQKQPPEQKKISKEDAERMLEAMKNDEKKTMEKVNKQKAKAVRVAVEKDW